MKGGKKQAVKQLTLFDDIAYSDMGKYYIPEKKVIVDLIFIPSKVFEKK